MPKNLLLTRRQVLWLSLGTFTGLAVLLKGKDGYRNIKILALDEPSRSFSVIKKKSL
jgi:hypothetical protein